MKLSDINPADLEVEAPSSMPSSLKLSDIHPDEVQHEAPLSLSSLTSSDYEVEEDPNKTGMVEAGAAGLGQGATLGFGDELAGLAGAALDPLLYGDEGKDFSQRYQENRDFARRQNEKAQQDSPGSYLAGQVGGGIASSLATGGGGAALGTKELVKRGVAEGAATGLGNSNADLTKGEYADAALDTAKGAAIGGALPIVGKGIEKVASKAAPVVQKIKKEAGEQAAKVGDFLNGFQDEAAEWAKKGTAKLLGVAESEILPEMPAFLKSNGLNLNPKGSFKGGQKALNENLDAIIAGTKEGDIELAKKAKEILGNSKGEFRADLSKMDAEDLVAFGLGGVKGVIAKKGKDAVWNRINTKAPEILDTLSQAPIKAVKLAGKAASKAGDIVEIGAAGLQRPSITNTIAQQMVDVPEEHRDSSPFEKVEKNQVILAQAANNKIVDEALKLGMNRKDAKLLGSRVEGAFYGSGHIMNEDTLGSPESHAENIITSAGPTLFNFKPVKENNVAKILGSDEANKAIPVLAKSNEISLEGKPEQMHGLINSLNKVNALSAIERNNNDVQNKINSGVKSFLSNDTDKKASSLYVTSKSRDQLIDDFKKTSAKLSEMESDPVALEQYAHSKIGSLAQYAPETAAGISVKLAAGLNFLNEKLPKNPNSSMMNLDQADWRPSDQEISKFNKYKRAIEAPLSIFEDMNKGVLSHEAMEAVQNIYPELYTKFQSSVTDSLSSGKVRMSYGKKIQLSLLMGTPLDRSMTPQSINNYQATYQQSDEQNTGGSSGGGGSISAESYMTDSQKLNS